MLHTCDFLLHNLRPLIHIFSETVEVLIHVFVCLSVCFGVGANIQNSEFPDCDQEPQIFHRIQYLLLPFLQTTRKNKTFLFWEGLNTVWKPKTLPSLTPQSLLVLILLALQFPMSGTHSLLVLAFTVLPLFTFHHLSKTRCFQQEYSGQHCVL